MLKHYVNFPLWNRKIIWVISLRKHVRLWNFVDLYNEITWLQHPVQSLLFKLIIKLSCPEKKKKEEQLKPKVEDSINIDNGKILLIITTNFVKTPIDIVIYDRLPLCIIDTGNCVPGKRENNDGSHTRGRNFIIIPVYTCIMLSRSYMPICKKCSNESQHI
jgi:hypothetical protein